MGDPEGVECGCSEAFADVLTPGLGHLQLLCLPKGQAFVYPQENPRTFDTNCFGLACGGECYFFGKTKIL